jgi:hypothetical protein
MRYKPLILFVVLLMPPIFIFSGDISRALEMCQINIAPSFVDAHSADLVVIERRKKDREPTFLVNYRFKVNGVDYTSTTTPTDRSGALRYLSEPNVQIVYMAGDPSKNTLKRYYDLRRNDSIFQLLVAVMVASLTFALPVSFLWSWRRGWLRRDST